MSVVATSEDHVCDLDVYGVVSLPGSQSKTPAEGVCQLDVFKEGSKQLDLTRRPTRRRSNSGFVAASTADDRADRQGEADAVRGQSEGLKMWCVCC